MDTFIVIGIGLIAYFLPTIIAAARNHHRSTAILVLNLFLGWTIIGWVISLVWALKATDGGRIKHTEFIEEPEPVENLITAKNGQLTYRVMAYRRMEDGELQRTVWDALQSGRLREPELGGRATLFTDIGRQDSSHL